MQHPQRDKNPCNTWINKRNEHSLYFSQFLGNFGQCLSHNRVDSNDAMVH